jgi:hypothetical protein
MEFQNNLQALSNESLPSVAQLGPSPDNTQQQQSTHDNPLQYPADSAVGTSNNLDLLWDWDWDRGADDFLPTTFFDTGHPLSDLWRTDTLHSSNVTIPTSDPRTCSISAQHMLVSEHAMTLRPLCERLPPVEPDFELSNNERLPIQEVGSGHSTEVQQPVSPSSPWNISVQAYALICNGLDPYRPILPSNFSIPSRRTLSRFFEAYFQEFHQHHPFLHIPTTVTSLLAPELILAIAAVGAFYRFEGAKGYILFIASKAIIMQHITVQHHPYDSRHSTNAPQSSASILSKRSNTAPQFSGSGRPQPDTSIPWFEARAKLQTMQALIIIMELASWSDNPMSREALGIASQLTILVREGGISIEDEIPEGTEWLEWIRREERRRTLFVAYVLFNMQSIAFNVPPMILNQDVRLCLPHCGSEWEATSSTQFMHLRHVYGHDERSFRGALEQILHGRNVHSIGPLSAFGNHVLIVGLVQQIFLERHVLRSVSSTIISLTPDSLKVYESAFQSWQLSWEATQESSLDPSSPKGPLGFDAAAMLRLAYIRLNANMGPIRDLMSKDPQCIAREFVCEDTLRLMRSPHLDRAILQCIHALSIPVRIGIPFVARSLALKRSIQHALCNLECAYLLSRWLGTVAEVVALEKIQSLREDERSLLGMIASLIRETDLASTLDKSEDDATSIRRMAASVVRLWADTFSGSHVFYIVDAIGTTLFVMADILEARLNE